MAQLHPVENGQGPMSFRRWYEDDVDGHMVPEDQVTRDYEGRLVDSRHVDKPAADELEASWTLPDDFDPPGPDEL